MDFDLVVVGVISLDTTMKVPFLPDKNSECFVEEIVETHGGGGANVAAYASFYGGLKVGIVAGVGNDAIGNDLVQRLSSYQVDTTGIIQFSDKKSTRIITALLKDGSRAYYVSLEAHMGLMDMEIPGPYSRSQNLYVAPCSSHIHEHLFRQGVENSMKIFFNPGSVYIEQSNVKILEKLLRDTEVLFVNREEALFYSSKSSLQEAGHFLLGSGPKLVVVTGGVDGTSIFSTDSISPLSIPGINIESINPVGAGDAFAAGFLSEYLVSKNLVEAARKGNMFGAYCVMQAETRAPNPSLSVFREFLDKAQGLQIS